MRPFLVASLLLLSRPAEAAVTQVLRGPLPPAQFRSHPLERLARTNALNLAIALPLRHREALTNLLRQIYDPASPNYRRFLTPEQFTERFGPTEADYRAVVTFALSNGLHVTGTHPNRTLLD